MVNDAGNERPSDRTAGGQGEYVALHEPGRSEDLVHLHDYERLYGVPGLYEHVVQDLLACCSPQVAVDGLAGALAELKVDPASIVLLDLARIPVS